MERDEIDEIAEGAIIMDGFDDCIVGISEEFGMETRIVYSKQRMIQKLIKNSDMTKEESLRRKKPNFPNYFYGSLKVYAYICLTNKWKYVRLLHTIRKR